MIAVQCSGAIAHTAAASVFSSPPLSLKHLRLGRASAATRFETQHRAKRTQTVFAFPLSLDSTDVHRTPRILRTTFFAGRITRTPKK